MKNRQLVVNGFLIDYEDSIKLTLTIKKEDLSKFNANENAVVLGDSSRVYLCDRVTERGDGTVEIELLR